jgi:UDP-3-O-[3-hydroxymyristoyl] glucosamine N-acyltransferase
MADPRFYDNRGPFTLAEICRAADVPLPDSADGSSRIDDVASLTGASASHITFYSGEKRFGAVEQFSATKAGFSFVPTKTKAQPAASCLAIPCASVPHAFAAAAKLFYPESGLAVWQQDRAIDKSAKIGTDVILAPGVVIGPGVEIGDRTRIGPNTAIGRGVAIGKDCEIGANVSISHSHLGDGVVVLSGAQLGNPGFGFASSQAGHVKIPQLGRVIVQDRVEIGACTTIDRAALGDTVIGEGTKIDNLVQIGHNTKVGRHAIIVSQVGISGSCELGDFVVLAGQVGVGDHTRIGDGARLAGRTGVMGDLEGGQDYGGIPAKPLKEWAREIVAISNLTKRGKKQA